MNSHELAEAMKQTAEWLAQRPAFELPWEPDLYLGQYWSDKEGFLTAARALGSGKKILHPPDLEFRTSSALPLFIRISRSAVCRKVQEEKWECEPLLSQEEEAQLEVTCNSATNK